MDDSIQFGQIIRERRSALGLTQAELASQVNCATVTVRKIERNALRPSVQLATLLAQALDIAREEQRTFVLLARQERPPTPLPSQTPSSAEIGLEDLTGRSVKSFQLAERIGSGGYGVVYRAIQPSVQRDVAVKIILPQFANQPLFIRQFEAEACLVARLEHPHIVPLYDYWREPAAAYLIMRLLRGGSLATLLKNGPLPLETFARIFTQVGRALGAAHAQGIVHRDIKPANVLLDDISNAYLADFGIAKNLINGAVNGYSQPGTSPAYLSPEQILREPTQPASDIYCLGLLLYEMVTGHQPFSGPTPEALAQQHLTEPLPLIGAGNSVLPADLDSIIGRATAKDPAARYQDVSALLEDLSAVLKPSLELPTGKVPLFLSEKKLRSLANPYRGLRAFTEADKDKFFGRDALVSELLELIGDGSDLSRFVAITGPSGSGKSSIAKAGLLPALRAGRLPGSENWYMVDLTPGFAPWEELASALRRVASEPEIDWLEILEADSYGLLSAADRLLPDDETELLLLIDQFEELFTLVEDEALRAHFLESLVMAILDPASRLRVVVTMRADFMDRPLHYVDFGDILSQRLALVLPMSQDELTQVITGPLSSLGMSMEPELLTTIINYVGAQPGVLPLLQYALTELFEVRKGAFLTRYDYHQTGGVDGALAGRADQIYDDLSPAEQSATRQLFLRLITLGEGVEDTRRRVLRTELEALALNEDGYNELAGEDVVAVLLASFGRYRLLTFDNDPATRAPTVEVAHEALLRKWPRLRGWVQDSRNDMRRQRLMAAAQRQWNLNDRDGSYLLAGSRLSVFEEWAAATTVQMTVGEQDFLKASRASEDARQGAEAARMQRELKTAQQLAATERERSEAQAKAATILRQRAKILAGALIIAGILATLALVFAQQARNNAALASAREAEAREAYSLSLAANARQALLADDQPLALLLALAANTVDEAPTVAWQTLVDIAYAPGVRRQFNHTSPINALTVDLERNLVLTGSDDGQVLLWDSARGVILQRLAGHPAPVGAVAISPDGKQALSGGEDNMVILWDLESGELLKHLVGHKGDISGVVFMPDGRRAISSENTVAAASDLIVWDLASGVELSRLGDGVDGNQEGTLGLALSPDGRLALAGQYSFFDSNGRPLALWDVENGTLLRSFSAGERTLSDVDVSPDGTFALAASADGLIYQWELASGEQQLILEGHFGEVKAVAISLDGQTALSAGLDEKLIWWDLATGRMIRRLDSGSEIRTLQFTASAQAVTAGSDGSLRFWDLENGWQLDRWGKGDTGHQTPAPGPENRGMGLAISPDGQLALSGGNAPDHSLILWEYATGEIVRRLEGHAGSIFDIAFTRDGKKALSASQDGTLILWDLQSGQQILQLIGHQGSVNSVEISDDGRFAVSGSLGGGVIYWDLGNGELLHRLIGHFEGRGVYDVAFLPGDQQAISSSWDATLIVWDLVQGEQLERLTGLNGTVGSHFGANGNWGIHGISLAPSGHQLLTTGRDNSLLLWDLDSGDTVRRFNGHGDFVVDVTFTPDGRSALSTAQNDALILWDVASGTPLRRLPINDRLDSAFRPTVAMHPDGQTALSTDADGTLLKWQLTEPARAELLAWLAENRQLRELSCAERERYRIEPLCQDGLPQANSADLLTGVRAAADLITDAGDRIEEAAKIELPERIPMARYGHMATMGDNPGELSRHTFDVWEFEGRAGQVLQFELLADTPLVDVTIPLAERFAAGALDTLLFVIAPDGTVIGKANDEIDAGGALQSDANIEAIVLPTDGVYRIEARSYLDDGAGGYILRLTDREYQVDVAVLEEYAGQYFEPSWAYNVTVTVEDDQLVMSALEIADKAVLAPLSDTEFLAPDGIIFDFTRDANGEINGYRIWISLVHEIGGQWYEGIKVD